MKALLLYSGGLDSTILLYKYKDEIKLAVSFNYGSRQNPREIECAIENTKKLDILHLIIDLDFFKEFNRFKKVPEVFKGDYEEESMRKMFVPFRNGIFISVAIGLADDSKLDVVYTGIHTGGTRPAYPDNTPGFITGMNLAAQSGTYQKIEVISPYQSKTKREIVSIGKSLSIEYSETWSCYLGLKYQCGKCSACLERREALKGFDNTIYEEEE